MIFVVGSLLLHPALKASVLFLVLVTGLIRPINNVQQLCARFSVISCGYGLKRFPSKPTFTMSRLSLITVPTSFLLQWMNATYRQAKERVTSIRYKVLKTLGRIRLYILISAGVVLPSFYALRADIKSAESLRQLRWNMCHVL